MEATGIRLFGTMISCPHSLKMDEMNSLEEDEQLRPNNQEHEAETEGNATNSPHDILKKPDKILPCPRCNSMDTKFCYYNNYNVKQPRHLCKSCQRYWTAGGTRRTMPVGAGRRKPKNPTSSCRFENIYHEAPNVISFGMDLQHVDSSVSCVNKENTDDCSSGSTVTTSNSVDETTHARNSFPNVPCIPGVAWSYNPWNSVIPIPVVYPSTYLNYIHWLPVSSTPSLGKHSRDVETLTPNVSEEIKKHKSSVLVPKTLRIDDPDEAAKSSVWSTLGITNETIGTRGIFNGFGKNSEENNKQKVYFQEGSLTVLVKTAKKTTNSNAYPVLQANPAALSRSLYFQEGA